MYANDNGKPKNSVDILSPESELYLATSAAVGADIVSKRAVSRASSHVCEANTRAHPAIATAAIVTTTSLLRFRPKETRAEIGASAKNPRSYGLKCIVEIGTDSKRDA